MTELLVPAGNEACADVAIANGADAVYLGLSSFSARAGAENFSEESLAALVKRAHLFGVKIYVAMNTLVKDAEKEDFIRTLLRVYNMGADAVILQDIFLGKYLHGQYPLIPLHLSTQAGTNNLYGARLAKEYGFSRVILARETPIEEIKKIAAEIETEVFIQGALCTCFSGQCYLSGFAGGNSGNRGRCKQPCRKKYAYDRAGYEQKEYALSLSDLSVGEKIAELKAAGVTSFKVEGRMRRAEYVAAALQYYKKILQGEDAKAELSALKRVYNRNNYTYGLAFGQDKKLLSRRVQGHIGEKVGVATIRNRRVYCESRFPSVKGDCFKIIRNGREVGGAVLEERDGRGFYLASRARVQNGDGVFITTDTALNERLLQGTEKSKLPISLTLRFAAGERAEMRAGDFSFQSDFILEEAKSAPLQKQDLISCFLKSDSFAPVIDAEIEGHIFLAKSVLNALRRDFYAALEHERAGKRDVLYEFAPLPSSVFRGENSRLAVLSPSAAPSDIFVFKPDNYADGKSYEFLRAISAEKYLYLPPFMSQADFNLIEDKLPYFDGVYAEGVWGIAYAKEKGKKLFAGTGFNLTNALSLSYAAREAAWYALSKELDFREQKPLCSGKSFVLSAGSIKVMDLIYCPFEKTCASCDKRTFYALTDENGRVFPVRRYQTGGCRFEVYNCAFLVAPQSFTGTLADLTGQENKREIIEHISDGNALKRLFVRHTSGHSDKTIL